MNQFRCKQLKRTVVFGLKTLVIGFAPSLLKKPSPYKGRRLFNYGHQQATDRGKRAGLYRLVLGTIKRRKSPKKRSLSAHLHF